MVRNSTPCPFTPARASGPMGKTMPWMHTFSLESDDLAAKCMGPDGEVDELMARATRLNGVSSMLSAEGSDD